MSTRRILVAWAVLAGLMVCNGAFRVGVLYLLMSPAAAETTSVVLGMIVIVAGSRPWLVDQPPQSLGQIARVSGTWLALTILFEWTIGLATGQSVASIASAYAIWKGALWPLVLLSVVVAPFIWLPRRALPEARTAP